jgi:hypothetical protein
LPQQSEYGSEAVSSRSLEPTSKVGIRMTVAFDEVDRSGTGKLTIRVSDAQKKVLEEKVYEITHGASTD